MSKTTMRLVYVATPYAGLRCNEKDRDYLAYKIANDECAKIKNAGYEPISPIRLFVGIYDESERERIMNNCFEILSHCSYVYFSSHPGAKDSQGMALERKWARELGITELDFNTKGSCEPMLGF